jgi:hypothetical protein
MIRKEENSILLCGNQLTRVQRYRGSPAKIVFSYNIFYLLWGQYMWGAPERLPAFGARTFLVISQQ